MENEKNMEAAEVFEEIEAEVNVETTPSLATIEDVFFAMVKENDGEFPTDTEKAVLRFSELAPALVREARLADVFLACGGSVDLVTVKADTAAVQKKAVDAVVKEMYDAYWIDKTAAEAICADFLNAIGAKAAAEEETLCELAERYFFGKGVPQDKEKAAELYNEAANQGDMNARYSLAYMYDKGDGIDKDRDKAILWYEKAADQGHEGAQNRLGILKNLRAQAQPAAPAVEEEPKKKKGFFGR